MCLVICAHTGSSCIGRSLHPRIERCCASSAVGICVPLVCHKAAQSLSCWCKHALQSYLGFILALGLSERSFRLDLPAHTNTHTHTTRLSLSITHPNARTKNRSQGEGSHYALPSTVSEQLSFQTPEVWCLGHGWHRWNGHQAPHCRKGRFAFSLLLASSCQRWQVLAFKGHSLQPRNRRSGKEYSGGKRCWVQF